jgi:hypothetical protein
VTDEHRGLIVRPEERISLSKSMRNGDEHGSDDAFGPRLSEVNLLRSFNGLENRLAKALARPSIWAFATRTASTFAAHAEPAREQRLSNSPIDDAST